MDRKATATAKATARTKGPARRPLAERLEGRRLLAADPVISEFMASNGKTVADQDGEYSDWIEVRNPNPAPLDLAGWHLTDDASPAGRTKWTFPATTVPANGHLLVFASDKNRAVAGQQLHTNFKLGADGEYLALTRPDGSVAHEYAPAYPAQQEDVAYGLPSTTVGNPNAAKATPTVSTG